MPKDILAKPKFVPSIESRKLKPAPFTFKTEELGAQRQANTKSADDVGSQFRARPKPQYSFFQPKPGPQKEPTTVEPFSFEQRGAMKKEPEPEIKVPERENRFKARPAPSFPAPT